MELRKRVDVDAREQDADVDVAVWCKQMMRGSADKIELSNLLNV
jgi:hypothetical protein